MSISHLFAAMGSVSDLPISLMLGIKAAGFLHRSNNYFQKPNSQHNPQFLPPRQFSIGRQQIRLGLCKKAKMPAALGTNEFVVRNLMHAIGTTRSIALVDRQ